MEYSSEMLKRMKNLPEMTEAEKEKWIKSIDPDEQGFDGHEGMLMEEGEIVDVT